jgi:regulator of cell morphogenesis and NO signaling
MIITPTMKMANVIIQNHHLLAIIDRFGIKLGFGEKTVSQVCKEYNIPVDFFLEIVNTFNNPDFFTKPNMDSFPLSLIVDYLRKAHDFYLNVKVPEIRILINRMLDTENNEIKKAVLLISNLFDDYALQLKQHIEKEDTVVYPYVLLLEQAYETKDITDLELFLIKHNFKIDEYARNHDDIEEKLYDIKSLIIKYITPDNNYVSSFKVLGQLAHLEDDINDHSRMENKVLIPRVKKMEELLIKLN